MLTKDKVIAIQADLQAALKEVARKHGLSMSGTRINYSSTEFKLACNFADTDATGGVEIDPQALRNLKRNGWQYGLTDAMAGKEFTYPGRGTCVFHGLRGAKAMFSEKDTGKRWLNDARMIAELVKAAK